MVKIAIASGKGGTGKTFLSTNLFYSLKKNNIKVCLVDLDIEEPNDFVFFGNKLNLKEENVFSIIPQLDKDKCNLCGKCAEICEFNALFVGKEWLLFEDLCRSCTACINLCPYNALSPFNKKVGTLRFDTSLGFIEGRSIAGVTNVVPIVKKAKEKAFELFNNYEVFILDLSPGIRCPTVNGLKNSDFVILVVEPTPFGFSDFQLIYDVVCQLKIPLGVVINKYGIGNNRIIDFCDNENIPILEKIPHSKYIAQEYSKGNIISEVNGEYVSKFINIYENIKKYININKKVSHGR